MDRKELLQFLQDHVSKGELQTLCFNLGVEYDDLPANGRADKARELVMLLERQGRLPELEAELTVFGVEGEGVPEVLRPYLELTARRYGRLPLGALDPSGQDSAHISLAQVFINLDGEGAVKRPKSGNLFYIWHQSALAFIHSWKGSILLGDPGSGKSTLLRFLTYCLAQAALAADDSWLEQLNWSARRLEANEEVKQAVSEGADEIIHEQTLAFWQKLFKEEGDFDESLVEEIEQHWHVDSPIPIFVELRDFARTDFKPDDPYALWNFVTARLAAEGLEDSLPALKSKAERGRVIFLLDGVDEVPPPERPSIWRAIAALEDGIYGGNRWVATCRVLSFVTEEAPAGIPNQTIRPLTPEQINQFISSWYTALYEAGEISREEADQKIGGLQTAVARPRLQPLAQNPMLLTIMALVQTFYGTLPDERAKLYQACVETLLLRWQRHKESEISTELPDVLAQLETTQEDLERLLWEIAWQAHSEAADRENAADIPEWDVLQIARGHLGSLSKAEAFLEYTERRAHLLVGRGGQAERVYTFPHRTFQEYLAACHLASQRRFSRQAAKLARDSETWRETLNLAAGTLVYNQNNREKALDGVDGVLPDQLPEAEDEAGWRCVWLAAEMMLVVGREAAEKDEVGQELLPKLRQMLVALLEQGQLSPRQRAEAGDALGLLGDPRPGVCTLEPQMIPIPAGPFLMHDEKVEARVDAFAIARYPVTNAQFRFFVEDGGYENEAFWTQEGWHYRHKEHWMQPRYWDDAFTSIDNKPVVGVSWYEAVAYCRWLSTQTGKTCRLPTEAEWERAARHTDGRTYPWGNKWLEGIINSRETGVNRTTAVGSFPQGAAECGAQDMIGNAWEWCQTKFAELPYRGDDGREDQGSADIRCLRGGAFNDLNQITRAEYRGSYYPDYRYYDLGFRVIEQLSLPDS